MLDEFGAEAIQTVLSYSRTQVMDCVGLVAGSMVAMSGIPKVLQRLKRMRDGAATFDDADLWRDATQAAGNALWVAVGINLGLVSVTLFCSVQAVLMLSLIYLNVQSLRTRSTRFSAAPAEVRGVPK